MAKPSAESLARDNQAIDMRARRVPWSVITTQLGYASEGAAQRQVSRRLKQRQEQLNESADTLLQVELAELDLLTAECHRILAAATPDEIDLVHLARAFLQAAQEYGENPDDWPLHAFPSVYGNDERVLQAVDRLHKLGERRAKLLGLDKPQLTEGGLTITIKGVSEGEMP